MLGLTVHVGMNVARDSETSFLASPDEMAAFLDGAGFTIVDPTGSSAEGLAWFAVMAARLAESGRPPVTFATFLGSELRET